MKSSLEIDMIFEDLDNKYQLTENLQTGICDIMTDLEHIIQSDDLDRRLIIDELDDIIDLSNEIKSAHNELIKIANKFKIKLKR